VHLTDPDLGGDLGLAHILEEPQPHDLLLAFGQAGEKVLEWTVALPAAPGDVSRAARRALSGRRRLGERRRPARQSLDRRRP